MPGESVTAILLVRVGSRDETKQNNGLSHFFEHMVFKGTEKWPTTQAVNQVIDSVGGIFNAFTSQETTGFWVKVAKKHLGLALEFIDQTVFHSLLPNAELERERGVILEEIKMRDDDPMVKVGDSFVSQVYSATPLGWDVIGPAENIRNLRREDFLNHLKHWYVAENMVLVIAGAIDKKQIKPLMMKVGAIKHEQFSWQQDQPKMQIIEKPIEQAHFCLGLRTFERGNSDRYILTVLNTILGGNTSSHLWNEIREKRGLAYYVRSSLDSYWETGYLVTQAGCAVNKLAEAIKLTENEYLTIHKNIKDSELILAKEYLKGRLALSFEDNQGVAGQMAEDWLLEGKIRFLKDLSEGIEKVNLDDIRKLAKKIFQKNQLNLTIVGKVKQKAYI